MNDARACVLVVGAGPAGLAGAACLAAEGVPCEVVDAHGVPGGAYTRAYGAMELSSPTRYTGLPGLAIDEGGEYVTVSRYARYLADYASHHRIAVRRARVSRVERREPGFAVRFDDARPPRDFRCVVAATGMFDFPRMPAIEGLGAASLEAMHVARWPGAEAFRGRRLLVVGAATSAVEISEECARAGIEVSVAARGKRVRLLPRRILGRDIHDYVTRLERLPRFVMRSFCAGRESLPGTDIGFAEFRRRGLIRVWDAIARIDGSTVVFADASREEFDAVVFATGYRYEIAFLPDEVARAPLSGQPLADEGESRSWPGLFVIGMPCSRGLASPFLRGIAQDAPVIARRIRARLEEARAH